MYDVFEIYKFLNIDILEIDVNKNFGSITKGTILISKNISNFEKRIILSHELAHLLLQHERQTDRMLKEKQEKEADSFAFLMTFSYLEHINKKK